MSKRDNKPASTTFLKKGNRKVIVIGAGTSGYTKVLIPYTASEMARARRNDRLGQYNKGTKTHAPQQLAFSARVAGTIQTVANSNLQTKAQVS